MNSSFLKMLNGASDEMTLKEVELYLKSLPKAYPKFDPITLKQGTTDLLKPKRKPIEEFFMDIAQVYATRSTCLRRKCSCLFIKDNRLISVGYNSSPSGLPHCEDVGCLMVDGHCKRCLHAEKAGITYAASQGVNIGGSWVVISGGTPCIDCALSLVAIGVQKIYIDSFYPDMNTFDLLRQKNIPVHGLFKERPTDSMLEYLESYKIVGEGGRGFQQTKQGASSYTSMTPELQAYIDSLPADEVYNPEIAP